MMKRRHFFQILTAYAGAVVVGGCDDDSPNNTTSDTSGGGDGTSDTSDTSGGADADTSGEVITPSETFFPQSLASGDPRAESVIVWTRLVDAAAAGADLKLWLELSKDEAFSQRILLNGSERMEVTAGVASDHCVKVRLAGLEAATFYYYRFLYESAGALYSTRTGRTKTAPAADADTPVRFAFVACQDLTGRHYNTYAQLLTEELDFFVHLGDYVYETTGDTSFQNTGGRSVVFGKPEEAIVFNAGEDNEFFAAKSLDNYRDLYRTYRQDKLLQAVHERWPMIAIWDDHEFSDDAHGINGTYFDGRSDEADEARRKSANQAWFEHMPVDYRDAPDFQYDPQVAFPNDLEISRDLRFGRHLHLVLTDLRTRRSDHLVPEDAFPGSVILDQATLMQVAGSVPDSAAPYIDIDTYDGGSYKQALTTHAAALGFEAGKVTGLVNMFYINELINGLTTAGVTGLPAPIDDVTASGFERGYAFLHLGKRSPYGSLGSRYFLIKPLYELYAGVRYAQTNKASEQAMGDAQQAWFLETMRASDATWKVWGNEFCLVPLAVDLTALTSLPPAFAQQFLLSVEDWGGLPNRRDEVIGALAEIGNVVAITGDIHAFFAGVPSRRDDPSKRLVELVTAGISSTSYRQLLVRTASADPVLAGAGAAALAAGIESFLLDTDTAINPHLAFAETDVHGFAIVSISAGFLEASFHHIAASKALTDLTTDPTLASLFTIERFRVPSGSPDLQREVDGAWKQWDPATLSWVDAP